MPKSLREFKKPTFLTLALMVVEVLIEVLIPFYTADLVNSVKAGVNSLLTFLLYKRISGLLHGSGSIVKADEKVKEQETQAE